MKFKATIDCGEGKLSKTFESFEEAAGWIDSQNNNMECESTIELIDKLGIPQGGFIYSQKDR